MKATTKAALVGAFLASAAFSLVLVFLPRQARAQDYGGNEEYKIVSLVPYREVIGRMEQDLNLLASEGWKIRTGVGSAVILAR